MATAAALRQAEDFDDVTLIAVVDAAPSTTHGSRHAAWRKSCRWRR